MSDWIEGQLGDSIAALDAGVSVNSEDRPHGAGEIGVLKTSAVSGGSFLADQNKTVVENERRLVAEPVQGDSILVSRMNTPALVGESCYVSEAHPSLFLPDRLWQLKTRDRTKTNMRWLSFVLQSAAYRRHVEVHATGTSGSMKNLPKSKLLALPVSYPEPREQQSIAQILDTLETVIRETEGLVAKLAAVKQGLLHRYQRRVAQAPVRGAASL
jgi:type I restriction enzyme, S subunit